MSRNITVKGGVVMRSITGDTLTLGKYEKLAATGENDFIDSQLWYKLLDDYKVRLEATIAKEQA